MDHRSNLQLLPTALQCVECGGPILLPTPPPFRIDLVTGAIRNTRRDGDFARLLSGDLCGTCRLKRAEGSDAYNVLSRELADLRSVRALLGLSSSPPALQRFTWEITDTEKTPKALRGAMLTSYGVWCLSREPLPAGLTMRSLCYGLENGLYLCMVFALEILSLPDHPTELHSRWDPDSGEEWQEIRNMRPGTLGHRKKLLEAMELTWEARSKGGRRAGGTITLEDLRLAYREAEKYEPNPSQAAVASYLGEDEKSITTRTVRNRLKEDHDMDWETFTNLMRTGN